MKKPDAIKELQDLHQTANKLKYPSLPSHAMPKRKFTDKTSNGLTGCILRWLQLNNHKGWRQSSEGRYRPGKQVTDVIGRVRQMKGMYIPGSNVGHADVSSIINGMFVAWEVKMKDKQSEKQKQFQKEVEASGGKYFIVRSFDEFICRYNDIVKTTISKE